MAANDANLYPKRLLWMQEEETHKWVLVGLSSDGREIQDPRDYEDVRVPLPNQPSSRVWMRDEATGKWTNLPAEASKEELAQADAAVRRRNKEELAQADAAVRRQNSGQPSPRQHQQQPYRPRYQQGGATIHQRYAQRLGGDTSSSQLAVDAISEEEAYHQADDLPAYEVAEDGVRYHHVKPSDTFNFICLKYKVSADALRGANDFVGSTLQFAPKRLVIPPPKDDKRNKKSNDDDVDDDDNMAQRKGPLVESSEVNALNSFILIAPTEAAKEELAQPEAAVRWRNSGQPRPGHHQNQPYKPRYQKGGATIHQRYAQRLGGDTSSGQLAVDAISEEEAYHQTDDLPGEGMRKDGVRYHHVKPSDTFNFICLKYKVSADALRGANNFVGSTLQFAPKRLVIPPPKDDMRNMKSNGDVDNDDNLAQQKGPPIVKPPKADALNSFVPIALRKQPPAPTVVEPEEEVQYHWVEPDDSLRWICLKYKVNANDLRRANNFTGSNLKLAPKKLIIPKTNKNSKAKGRRPPRPRKMRSNGSMSIGSAASGDSYGSSTFSSSFLTSNTMPLKGDDSSVVGNSSAVGSMGEEATVSVVVGEGVPDMSPLGAAHTNMNSVEQSYRNLGSQGSEALSSLAVATVPAPISMVHLPTARKLYDQMDGDTDDSDIDTSENDSESPDDIGDSLHTSKKMRTRYHNVRPNDTIEYLCLKYHVPASALRRANIGLTGRNLQTGPKRLIIPPSGAATKNVTSHHGKTPLSNSSFTKIGFARTETRETHETETVTTFDDDTNTIALSDGHSTLADQLQSLEMLEGDNAEHDNNVVYHDIQPDDTLPGICLRYGISAYELRRANGFRGLNLTTAPDRLVIPRSKRSGGGGRRGARDFEAMSKEEKIQVLIAHLPASRHTKRPMLSHDEARSYLQYNNWNFDQALRNAKVDAEWSTQKSRSTPVRRSSGSPSKSPYR